MSPLLSVAFQAALWFAGLVVGLLLLSWLLGTRYIPNNRIGIVERLWSARGSLKEGRIIALDEEAGFQASILRGGLHVLYFPWQYRIHSAAAGGDLGRQDRLRLRARRPAAAADADARPHHGLQPLPGCRGLPAQERAARPPARVPARGRLRGQPRRCSSSSPRTVCSPGPIRDGDRAKFARLAPAAALRGGLLAGGGRPRRAQLAPREERAGHRGQQPRVPGRKRQRPGLDRGPARHDRRRHGPRRPADRLLGDHRARGAAEGR